MKDEILGQRMEELEVAWGDATEMRRSEKTEEERAWISSSLVLLRLMGRSDKEKKRVVMDCEKEEEKNDEKVLLFGVK